MKQTSSQLPSLPDILAFNAASSELDCDQEITITLLRNFTLEGIEPFLAWHCLQNRIRPSIRFGGYDTVLQDLMELSSSVHVGQAEVVVIALMLEQLDSRYGEPKWRADMATDLILSLFQASLDNTTALLAVNTFIPPYDADCGIAVDAELTERITEVSKINMSIRDFVYQNSSRFFLIDWERLARICGESETMDYRFWYMSKAPFKQSFLNLYAVEILKIVRALKGKAKKCLLLDCDNTLWGGIVGEEGVSGIRLDRHSYPGNIFHEFQKQVLRLHERGVLIALVSKNNVDDVMEVLDKHPDCLLKTDHLTAWRINWDDKAANIIEIAQELNLGMDSFVFVDDNPAECELVRTMLPDVEVLQVPSKLYLLPRLLARDGLFDTLSFSAEDRSRSIMYRAEAQRMEEKRTFASLDEYLASLDIVAMIRVARAEDISRIAQLTQKTNQFNLTTRRYSSSQIEAFSRSADAAVFSLSVSDRFGDSGLTGVLIAFREEGVVRIDTILLSCRILGRRIETLFLDYCLSQIQKNWSICEFAAEYIPSLKNSQAADFYDKAGFIPLPPENGVIRYRCNILSRIAQPLPYITVHGVQDARLS